MAAIFAATGNMKAVRRMSSPGAQEFFTVATTF
jgi:hypothetical protein